MPTGILDKTTGDQYTAAEFNIVKNLVDASEALISANAALIATNTTAAATADGKAVAAQADATQALADAASALSRANHTGTQTASTISDFQTNVSLNPDVITNLAKIGVPGTSTPGLLGNDDTGGGHTLSWKETINEFLASPADDAIIALIAGATWTSNSATIAGWNAGRKYYDGSYRYEAIADNTVYRIALGSGTDAVSLQGRNVATTAPTDGQVLSWNNGTSQWEPATVSGGGGGNEFADSVFRVTSDDTTKKVRFDVSAITGGQTRTIIMPDTNVDLANLGNFTSSTITSQTEVTPATGDYLIITDATDSDALKKVNVSNFLGGGGDMLVATYDPGSITEQLVGLTATQTLTNKTLTQPVVTVQDSEFTIQDNADNTKQLNWQLSNISTGQTRTITAPDADMDLGDLIEINGTGLVAGDMLYYDGTEFVRDSATTGDAQTAFTLGYAGSLYTGSTAASYTINATGLAARQSAIALITNASEPTFTLSGGTVTKVGWGSNWDASNQNHVTFVAASSTLVYAYLSGAEA